MLLGGMCVDNPSYLDEWMGGWMDCVYLIWEEANRLV